MRTIANSLQDQMHVAWIRLLTFGFGMGLAYEVASHVIYWLFSLAFGLFGGDANHYGTPPPESQIEGFEIAFGWLAAYLFGAFGLSIQWVQGGFMAVGRAQNVSPALLYVAGQGVARTAEMWLFPVAFIVLVPYLVWQTLLFIATLVGAQAMLERWMRRQSQRPANVTDINARSTWQGTHPIA